MGMLDDKVAVITGAGSGMAKASTKIFVSESDVAALFDAAIKEFGRVDAVLNVAGIGSATPLTDVSMEDYDKIMDVDLRGVLLGMKYGIRAMLETGGGAIVNWS